MTKRRRWIFKQPLYPIDGRCVLVGKVKRERMRFGRKEELMERIEFVWNGCTCGRLDER